MLKLRDILRTNYVKRWSMVRTRRPQLLSEHHAFVALYFNCLTEKILLPHHNLVTLAEVMDGNRHALTHDAPEVVTGDIPSPMKKWVKAICNQFHKDLDPFAIIESQIAPWIKKREERLSPLVYGTFKIADDLDALVFISTEGLGHHAETVRIKLADRVAKRIRDMSRNYPQCDWSHATRFGDDLLHGPSGQAEVEKAIMLKIESLNNTL